MTKDQTTRLLQELEALVRSIRIQGQKESEGKSQDEKNALGRKLKNVLTVGSEVIADKHGLPRSELPFYIALAIKMDEQLAEAGIGEETEENSQSDADELEHIKKVNAQMRILGILVLLIAAGIVYWCLSSLGAFK